MIQLEEKLCEKLTGLCLISHLLMTRFLILLFLEDGGVEYLAFCDSGYALGHVFITPFSRRRDLTPEEREFNRFEFLCSVLVVGWANLNFCSEQ